MKEITPLAIGGEELKKPIVIAGPCSAETEEQVLATAQGLNEIGVRIFRAGIWKPRTMPGNFEGVGEPGLAWLKKVREVTGMKVSTEVATRAHVQAAIDYDVDILWIGARTSANPFAVQEIADTLGECGKDIPVLVKNPVNPDIDLWIGALERLHRAGIRKLGVIHRGFSYYGTGIYRNTPEWRIPLELRTRFPEIPIICDPSHIGGKRDLIAPISQQALDMGFDGLIIESHCDPDAAWSDASQQITPETLKSILDNLTYRNTPVSKEGLAELRARIDELDEQLIEILSKRMEVSREIGEYKKCHKMPIVQPARFNDVIASRVDNASQLGLDRDFMRKILSNIHEESVRVQIDLNKGI